MKWLAVLTLVALTITGCDRGSGQGTGLRRIDFEHGRSPAVVLFEPTQSVTCRSLRENFDEIQPRLAEGKKFEGELYFVDTARFRAYYQPRMMVARDHAAFVFCDGAGSPYIPNRCALIGMRNGGCFQAELDAITPQQVPVLTGRIQATPD